MIKYICVPTMKCNFIVARVDMDPVYDNSGSISRYRMLSTRKDLPQNAISWWKISRDRLPNQVFDTLAEAENYAKSQMDSEKEKHMKKFENFIKYYQKLLDKISDHNPKIKVISLVR